MIIFSAGSCTVRWIRRSDLAGIDSLGKHSRVWDAQKDMALALLGTLIALACSLVTVRYDRASRSST